MDDLSGLPVLDFTWSFLENAIDTFNTDRKSGGPGFPELRKNLRISPESGSWFPQV